jgi:multiple sugar transport system permease protein
MIKLGSKGIRRTYGLMLLPLFIILLVFTYIPLANGIKMAFMRFSFYNMSENRFNGLENFMLIFTDTNVRFVRLITNTILWVIFSVAGQFTLGFILAMLLRKPFKGRGIYTAMVFYVWAVSGFAMGLTWSWLYNGQFGIINDIFLRIGLISEPVGFLSNPKYVLASVIVANIWMGIPFFGIMFLAALQSIPNELYEAAMIDGAGKPQQFFNVTVPYIQSTINTTILLRLIWMMNAAELIYGMTEGGPANATNTLAVEMIKKTRALNYGRASSMGFIILVILLIFTCLYLRLISNKEMKL